MAAELGLGLIGTGLGLGLRHGIDWDHIAAITDVTATQGERRKGLVLGTVYALGHATVVTLLGLMALWAGSTLPEWLDTYMEVIVGVTLVALGVWVFWSLLHDRQNFQLRSRWMLVFRGVRNAYRWAERRVSRGVHSHGRYLHSHEEPEAQAYTATGAFGIGMIHGVGAETGSQVLLFASAAGAESDLTGSLLLLAFVAGLVVSNSLITLGSVAGFWGSKANTMAYLAIGVVTGAFSLIVGTLFLLQRGGVLPGLFT